MPLNIDWQQILLHLFNFTLLFGILYFLLYQPVKKFMDGRVEYYKNMDDQAKKALDDAQNSQAAYAEKLANAEDEIAAKKAAVQKDLEAIQANRTKQAEADAEKLMAEARVRMENERAKMMRQAKDDITELVTAATEKIVVGGSTSDAYDRFLETAREKKNHD